MSRKSAKHNEPEEEEAPVTAEIAAPELAKVEEAPVSDDEAVMVLQTAVMSAPEATPAVPSDPVARVRELEDAIRRHRETAWKVHGPHRLVDRALYAVLEAKPVGAPA